MSVVDGWLLVVDWFSANNHQQLTTNHQTRSPAVHYSIFPTDALAAERLFWARKHLL